MTLLAEPTTGLAQFRSALAGRTVVVLGSGGLDYMRPQALRGLPVIAVNSSARLWGLPDPYAVVVKEHREEALPNRDHFPGVPVICAAGDQGLAYERAPDIPGVVFFDHLPNRATEFDVFRDWPVEPDQLVVSMSTITTAMHFAAYAGASVILVCGLVCGTLEGQTHFRAYGPQPEWMPDWLAATERQALAVKRELMRRYDCDVLGLAPWISPDLDGLTYRGATNRVNAW